MAVIPTSAIQQIAAKGASQPFDIASPKTLSKTNATQENSFQNTIRSLLESANQPQNEASTAINDLVAGRTDNLHSVVVSVAKAEMSFRFLLEMRNRLTEAYQEIMRMQM